jgi:hypothetical protein
MAAKQKPMMVRTPRVATPFRHVRGGGVLIASRQADPRASAGLTAVSPTEGTTTKGAISRRTTVRSPAVS